MEAWIKEKDEKYLHENAQADSKVHAEGPLYERLTLVDALYLLTSRIPRYRCSVYHSME